MNESTTADPLSDLEPFPLLKRCFEPYVRWFLQNAERDWEQHDVVSMLVERDTDRLERIETLLSQSQSILGIDGKEFARVFGFNDDLHSKDAEKIHDILAEPLFVIDLDRNGFTDIKKLPPFIKRGGQKTPNSDFTATRTNYKFAIELKTIRMEAKPKPKPGELLGDATKPSWWLEMFRNNALAKINAKNQRALHQLKNAANYYKCEKKMLVLYTRRIGPSALMDRQDYQRELEFIKLSYPELDIVASKDYFGEVVFYPHLDNKKP